MNDLINHPILGQIEPIREAKMTLPTWGVEGIEIVVAVTVLYFMFFKFIEKTSTAKQTVKPKATEVLKKEKAPSAPGETARA